MKKLNNIPALPKSVTVLWIVLRAGLLAWGIFNMFMGHTTQFLQSVFAIAFTHLWDFFQLFGGRSFITRVPYSIQTYLNIFIFAGCVVGTTVNLYTSFEHIDIILHFFAGVLGAAFGYDLAVIIQTAKRGELSPALAAMFALFISISISVGWEFYEFSMDRIYGMDLQRSIPTSDIGLVDTMVDLILGTAGALTGMFVTAFRRNRKHK